MFLFDRYIFKLFFHQRLVTETLTPHSRYMKKLHKNGLGKVTTEEQVMLFLLIFNSSIEIYFVFHIVKAPCTCTGILFWLRCTMGRQDIQYPNIFRLPLLGFIVML